LRNFLADKGKPLIVCGNAFEFCEPEANSSKGVRGVLKQIIDWDCVGPDDYSVYWAGAKRGDESDVLKTLGVSLDTQGRGYVVDSKLMASVQTRAFEVGCKSTKLTTTHDTHAQALFAKIPTQSSRGRSEIKSLDMSRSTRIGISEEKVEWRSLFEQVSPQISIPFSSKDAFNFDSANGSITSISEFGRSCFWIFTPSYRRHLQGVTTALLDRSEALADADFVQVLVVRCGEEFEHYSRDFGKDYVVIGMPDSMSLDTILTATRSTQFKEQKMVDGKVKVDASSGVGYARLFAQIFSRLMELPTVWMLDDNVQSCYYVDVNDIFKAPQNGEFKPLLPPPRPCTFTDIIRAISAQFGGQIDPLSKESKSDKLLTVPAYKPEHLGNLMDNWENAGTNKSLQSCPIEDHRQTPRCNFGKQGEWGSQDPKNLGNFSGASKEFAVVGMSRDPAGFARYQSMKHPFKVTHSVYSFYLLNVQHTVDRGVFYPPKTFWEDIHFNQLCEEKGMAVLKCRHLFHHKKNLQVTNRGSKETMKTVQIPISITGRDEKLLLDVKQDKTSCKVVWPQILTLLQSAFQGCIVVRAHAGGEKVLLTLKHDDSLENNAEPDAMFTDYTIELLYSLKESESWNNMKIDQTLVENGGIYHRQLLRAWMASNKIRTVFTWLPDTENANIETDWKLLELETGVACKLIIEGFRAKSFSKDVSASPCKVPEPVYLTVICDAVDDHGGKSYILDSLQHSIKKMLNEMCDNASKLQRVHFIFPAQLVASDDLARISKLFECTHSERGRYSSRLLDDSAEVSARKEATFIVLVLERAENFKVAPAASFNIAPAAAALPQAAADSNADGKAPKSPHRKFVTEEAVSSKKAARSSQKGLGSTKKTSVGGGAESTRVGNVAEGNSTTVRTWEEKWATWTKTLNVGGYIEAKGKNGKEDKRGKLEQQKDTSKWVVVCQGPIPKEYDDAIAFVLDGEDLSAKSRHSVGSAMDKDFKDKDFKDDRVDFALKKLGDIKDTSTRGKAISRSRSIYYRASNDSKELRLNIVMNEACALADSNQTVETADKAAKSSEILEKDEDIESREASNSSGGLGGELPPSPPFHQRAYVP